MARASADNRVAGGSTPPVCTNIEKETVMSDPLKPGSLDPERKADWIGAGLLTRAAGGSNPPGFASIGHLA